MYLGDKIDTSLGEVVVIDVKPDYLILYSDLQKQFIKAIYYQSYYGKIIWQYGHYYSTFDDLLFSLND